jgi:hypothetical protein
MAEKHLALLIELPATYVADIIEGGTLNEYRDDFDTDSAFILNCVGEPGVVRVRMEISGEKDGEVVEVWGHVREASIVDAGRGYGNGPHLTDEQLADAGGYTLMRDEDACEWCQFHEPPATDERPKAAS